MTDSSINRMERYVRYALVILGIVFVVLVIFLISEYRTLRHAQVINARESILSALLKRHGPLVAADAEVIRSWMTFDYINKTFGLPADYLKMQLQISDPRYPNLSLSSYAKVENLDSTAFVGNIVATVRTYLLLNSPQSASSSAPASASGTLRA